jgi:LacI family transcriptional regulator
MTDLVRHLVEVHGIRSAPFVGADETADYRARFAAFRETLRQAGIEAPARPVEREQAGSPGVGETEVEEAERDRAGLPDAFVCRNDADALDLLEDLRGRGIRVPEDVIVTGFDGLAAGLISRPPLTTVRQPMHDLGVAAVELLLNRIADPESPAEHRRFPVSLTVRASCGCR